MLNLHRGAFPFGIGAAFAAALLLFCLAAAASEEDSSSAVSAPVVTDGECDDRWTESEAADDCTDKSITAEDSMCRIIAECPVSLVILPSSDEVTEATNTSGSNNILVTPNEAAQLHNCNGVLTVGSC